MNLIAAIGLVIATLAFLAAGRTHGLAGRPVRTRLLLLCATTLLAGLLLWLMGGREESAEWIPGLFGLALIASLWVAVALIVSLSIARVGRIGWIGIALAVLTAALTAFTTGSVLLVLLLLLPLTLRTPWLTRGAVGLWPRGLLLLGNLGALIVYNQQLAGNLPALPVIEGGLIRLGLATVLSFAVSLSFKLLLRLPGSLFDRLRLRSRLVISYGLVAGPVLLVAVFLVILALTTIGGHRSTLIASLTSPSPRLQALARQLVEDPEFPGALQAPAGEREELFDRLVRRQMATHLGTASLAPRDDAQSTGPGAGPEEIFVLAALREMADTTRVEIVAGPRGLTPAGAAALHRLTPPCPFDGFVLVDSLLFATHGVTLERDGYQRLVQICQRVSAATLDAAAELSEVEFLCAFTDSIQKTVTDDRIDIEFGSDLNQLRFASSGYEASGEGGFFLGVQMLETVRCGASDTLSTAGGLLLVRAEWGALLASITDTVRNPLNGAIRVVLIIVAALFLIVELIAILTGSTIARNIHRAIMQLTLGTRRLAEDDLDHRLKIERRDELGELGNSFNVMAEGLKERRRLIVEQQRFLSELKIAHDIQQRMLPVGRPDVPGLDVAGTSVPSREVGGDAYDFLLWGERELAVTIADVSGKGVPAALLMSNLQASVRAHARRPAALPQIMTELNELIVASTDVERFITFFLGVIEPKSRALRYVNAGHNPPLLVRRGGELESLSEGGILLGTFPEAEYRQGTASLADGDVLVLFTDGVVEAQSGPDKYFDDERLEQILRRDLSGLSASTIRDRIISAVQEFTGDEEQSDDVTVVVVRCLETERALPGRTKAGKALPIRPARCPSPRA